MDPYGHRYDDEYNEYYDDELKKKHGCTWSSVLVYHLMGGKGERGVGQKLQRRKEGDYID